MKGHKVVTVERQGGYAARCTVVVNGVETLCDATFAFDTRTQAREAITHEEAPGAVGAAAEGMTPMKGTEMNTPNSTQTETASQALEIVIGGVRVGSLPGWANKFEIHEGEDEPAITCSRTFGDVEVGCVGFLTSGTWRFETVRIDLPAYGPEGGSAPVHAVPELIANLTAAYEAVQGHTA